MSYLAIAHDPERGCARVFGTGATKQEAEINCLKELAKYLQNTPRWAGQKEFLIELKEG